MQRQCRNIVIYGHCKYQDKGCQYFHPPPDAPASPPPTAALSAHAINAPIFVPKAAAVPHDDYDEFSYTAADAAAVDDLTSGVSDLSAVCSQLISPRATMTIPSINTSLPTTQTASTLSISILPPFFASPCVFHLNI